ncbi:kinase-like protein [Pholiota conissans]|uniref:non-specific serine/threonine protein kinase n=1 Tax=Pholiota conissans TaxID=109636 RepID=A0A9P5YXE2_9AGAR|nr:kinase-like protein [Pholiota conissans]
MPPTQTYHLSKILGRGAYGYVFQALDTNSSQQVAVKKSRVSQKVLRPILKYESQILQLLRGHPAIPALYGYGQLPHFEYLAMDLLGPSIKECTTGPISVRTTVRVVLQMLSALKHIHSCGIVHRDIKPENILCSRTDLSSIILIDYNISLPIKSGSPARHDCWWRVIGTLHWESVNAHNGIDLAPRDDLESLAYVVFFLLYGNLPWIKAKSQNEPDKDRKRRVRESKANTSGSILGTSFPEEFTYLLDHSRSLQYDQLPDYEELQRRFSEPDVLLGDNDPKASLDWSAVETTKMPEITVQAEEAPNGEGDSESDADTGGEEDEKPFDPSFVDWYDVDWDIQYTRDRSLTLSVEMIELVNNSIPQIVEVTSDPDAE